MVFRNNKIRFLIRLLILAIGILILVYSALILKNVIRSFFAITFCVISVAEFFHFLNKTNRDFKFFITALLYEDFTNYYSKSKQKESEVYELFNKLNTKYRNIAYEKEIQHALLKTIIKHISVGILVINEQDEVTLVNDYLLKFLGVSSINSFNDLAKVLPQLKQEIENAEIGKPKLLELIKEGEIFRLSLNVSNFRLDGISYRLVSIQDINYELDEQEISAWQKLIRVLTHEIMNSVTPISSLTLSLNGLLQQAILKDKIETKHLDYLSKGLVAVQDRSEGLLKLTEAYKKLTQLKHPEFETINVEKLFESVILLHKAEMEELEIEVLTDVEQDIELLADKYMMEQVLINLVKNSIQAVEEINNAQINLKCFKENNRVVIQVEDNGKGIAEDKVDKIFIPFFTTKEKGSGIGLSFARQVMREHKGSINVKSVPNKTIFTLKF